MSSKIRVDNKSFIKMIFTKILGGVAVAALTLVVLYLAFAATIMRVIPSTNLGGVLVKNPSFEGGLIPEKAVVVVGYEDRPSGILGNLQNTFIPQPVSIVEIVAGPNGEIKWKEGGITTINGKIIDITLDEKPDGKFLSGRYIARCLEGCNEGEESVIVYSNQVLGIPLIENYRVEDIGVHESLSQSMDQSGKQSQ